MSPLWRDELRVGLCRDRLLVAHYRAGWTRRRVASAVRLLPIEAEASAAPDPIARLQTLVEEPAYRTAELTVVLSNHYLRYLVLPWSEALSTASDWEGYARLCFTQTYGSPAADWTLRVGAPRRGQPRLACAIDAPLMVKLLEIPRLRSIQPYLMSAFNSRRRRLGTKPAWFVLQEPGRVTLGLVAQGRFQAIRSRRIAPAWRTALDEMLDRESAGLAGLGPEGEVCEQAFLYAEDSSAQEEAGESGSGRYRVTDLTVQPGTPSEQRAFAMVLQ